MSAAAPRPTIADRYTAAFPTSKARHAVAKTFFPGGVTHDLRLLDPFPPYVDRAKGAHKWDVDGHELIDYFSGHGALLLGHSPGDVVKAVQDQMAKGTHPGACHELEIEWAQWVKRLLPSCEKLRFTGSGTEATLMALRLCRIHAGRPKFLKFQGHFHGWHDYVAPAADPPYDAMNVLGVPDAVAACAVALPPNDLNRVEDTLKKDDEIGAVILEPTGGHWGAVPIRGEFLLGLRELCTRYDRVLIFDEVITGFRISPGGAQAYYGVVPDLTATAKVLAGGLPGGCLVGKKEILDHIEVRPGKPKMRHPGTYNANPLSAAAGVAALKRVATGEPTARATRIGRLLRNKLNALFAAKNWPWVSYGDFSMWRVLPNYRGPRPDPNAGDHDCLVPYGGDVNQLDGPKNTKLVHAFRMGMLLNGVDLPGTAGMTTCEHTDADVEKTVAAVERTVELLLAEGVV
jgi:glutamate-1-semialdehyde 2,1-aminomutase